MECRPGLPNELVRILHPCSLRSFDCMGFSKLFLDSRHWILERTNLSTPQEGVRKRWRGQWWSSPLRQSRWNHQATWQYQQTHCRWCRTILISWVFILISLLLRFRSCYRIHCWCHRDLQERRSIQLPLHCYLFPRWCRNLNCCWLYWYENCRLL